MDIFARCSGLVVFCGLVMGTTVYAAEAGLETKDVRGSDGPKHHRVSGEGGPSAAGTWQPLGQQRLPRQKKEGRYEVVAIKKQEGGYFSLFLRPLSSSQDRIGLALEVWHIPAVMRKGLKFRLTADVFSQPKVVGSEVGKQPWYKVHQMLAYLPRRDRSYHPVWFISRDNANYEKKYFSYLQIHVPAFDYERL